MVFSLFHLFIFSMDSPACCVSGWPPGQQAYLREDQVGKQRKVSSAQKNPVLMTQGAILRQTGSQGRRPAFNFVQRFLFSRSFRPLPDAVEHKKTRTGNIKQREEF